MILEILLMKIVLIIEKLKGIHLIINIKMLIYHQIKQIIYLIKKL